MRIVQCIVAAAIMMGASTAALGDEKDACQAGTPPVDCHFANGAMRMLLCRLSAELATLDATKADDARKCITDAKTSARTTYQKALRVIAKKPAATAALKKYQARLLGGLDGISPKDGETERDWKRRLNRIDEDLELAANEVRVEL